MPPTPRKKTYIFLASQSPRRSEILKKMNLAFEITPSLYNEAHHLRIREKPSSAVLRHAKGKALQATPPYSKSTRWELILGADTLVYFQGQVLGKPKSYKAAEEVLMRMAGKSHTVYTGIALIDRATGKLFSGYEKTRVTFHRWDRGQIKRYVKVIQALDKAGSYAIQMKPCIAKSIQGSLTNVIGLPAELLAKKIREIQTTA